MTTPPAASSPIVLWDGPLDAEWTRSHACFIGDGQTVDVFIRLCMPPPSIQVRLPVFFEFRVMLNPTGEDGDWYAEMSEHTENKAGECVVSYRPLVRRILGLEQLLVLPEAQEGGADASHHVRLELNARQLRLVFRGELGGDDARVKITALRGR